MTELVQPIASLGVGGFAIVVMWWMYQSASDERKRHEERCDSKDVAFRQLEKEVRTEITVQLAASTATIRDIHKVMDRVISNMEKPARRSR